MVEAIRVAEKARGEVSYAVTEKEAASRVFRRSLFAITDIAKGDLFAEDNIRSIRPGYGLHTRFLNDVFGRKATKNIKKGTPLSCYLFGDPYVKKGDK